MQVCTPTHMYFITNAQVMIKALRAHSMGHWQPCIGHWQPSLYGAQIFHADCCGTHPSRPHVRPHTVYMGPLVTSSAVLFQWKPPFQDATFNMGLVNCAKNPLLCCKAKWANSQLMSAVWRDVRHGQMHLYLPESAWKWVIMKSANDKSTYPQTINHRLKSH